jgi:ATP:ADP antiporter, AAA family
VGRSPYLLMICAYLFLYSLMSTLLYLEQGRIVSGAALTEGDRLQVFATMDVWANVVTLALQVLIAGRVIRWFGVGAALAVVPALTVLGFAALWAAPGLGVGALTVLMVFQVSRRGVQHALGSPARQVLFTVVSADAKYKSKAFIETFVYRGGDLVGAWSPRWIVRGLGQLGMGAGSAVAVVAVPVGVVGVGVALVLGRMFRARGDGGNRGEDAPAHR